MRRLILAETIPCIGLCIYTQQQESGVTRCKNTTESSTALPTELQSEETTTTGGGVPGSDSTIIQTSEPVLENGTITRSFVPIHLVQDTPLPMEMTAIEDETQRTSPAPSPQDNTSCHDADPDNQVRPYSGRLRQPHVTYIHVVTIFR